MKLGYTKGKARSSAYKWLAEQLGIENPAYCHISWMHGDDLRRVIEICKPWRTQLGGKDAG